MLAIFESVVMLFAFIAVGYVLGKTKIVNSEHTQILSKILVYFFLPCNVFKTYQRNFTPEKLKSGYELLLISTAILVLILVVSHFTAKLFSKERYERFIYAYSIAMPNYGYMGYALAESLLGEAGLLAFMIFSTPLSLYIHTYAYSRLTKKPARLKSLLDPTIIATVLGIIAGLCSFSLPDVFAEVIEKASGCMAPVGMIMTGIVISGFKLKSILADKKVYILTALRLVIIPLLLFLAAGLILKDKQTVAVIALFYALPCGINTIVFPRSVNENCEIGAGLALVSTVLALATLPIIMTVANI